MIQSNNIIYSLLSNGTLQVNMMQKVPLRNIYIMTMESFVHNAALEVEMLLKWLKM